MLNMVKTNTQTQDTDFKKNKQKKQMENFNLKKRQKRKRKKNIMKTSWQKVAAKTQGENKQIRENIKSFSKSAQGNEAAINTLKWLNTRETNKGRKKKKIKRSNAKRVA